MISSSPSRNAERAATCPPLREFDPSRPIHRRPTHLSGNSALPGRNQRHRRAVILASIRRLLLDEGCNGLTVRRIAECSGHAVQTIYNLVGPRRDAIAEAIHEYSQFVCLGAVPDPTDPGAAARMIDREIDSIRDEPEFCRRACLLFFGDSRDIFYAFRERQIALYQQFLTEQQRCGIIGPQVEVRPLSEQLVFSLGALFVEWADRPFPIDELRERLQGTLANLMSSAYDTSPQPRPIPNFAGEPLPIAVRR